MKLVFASGNAHKVAEVAAILRPLGIDVQPLALTVDEDAPTFVGNAEKKARAALAATGLAALADDSGLEVDALDGAPGVRSARFASDDGPIDERFGGNVDAANNAKLLRVLDDVPDDERGARFRCALVLVTPDGRRLVAEGACEGRIAREGRGAHGFGYDPLFVVGEDAQQRRMAELSPDEKNRISHRARALAALARQLPQLTAG